RQGPVCDRRDPRSAAAVTGPIQRARAAEATAMGPAVLLRLRAPALVPAPMATADLAVEAAPTEVTAPAAAHPWDPGPATAPPRWSPIRIRSTRSPPPQTRAIARIPARRPPRLPGRLRTADPGRAET